MMPAWNRQLACWALLSFAITAISGAAYAQLSNIQTSARLIAEGNLAQAENEARIALKVPATRGLAYEMLGTIRLKQGKYDEGSRYLLKALEINPHLVGARTTLGETYLLQNKPSQARIEFEKALDLNPSDQNTRLDLAKLEASRHNYQKSLKLAAPIEAEVRQSADGILLLATDYLALGQKEKVADLARQWAKLPDTSDDASISFGSLLMQHRMFDQAVSVLETQKSRSVGQPSFALAFDLGESYWSLKKPQQAEENYQIALGLKPSCLACNERIAEIAEQQGNTEKALAYLVKAKQLDPGNAQVLFDFGRVCLKRNLVDDALAALRQAVALKPDDDRYVYVLASAHVAKEQYPQALTLLGQLLKKHPEDPVLNYSVGAVSYLQGKYDMAETLLKKSIRERPDQIASYYYLGLTYQRTGRNDQAEEQFWLVVRQDPKHAASYAALGEILLKEKKYEEARHCLEQAVSLDPDLINAHYQLGLLLGRTGKTTESSQQIAIARKLETDQRVRNEMQLHILMPE